MRRIRIDFAISLVIAFAIGALVNFVGGKVIDNMEKQTEEVVYSDSQIGAAPTEHVPVISSISEMMEEEYFTFHVTDTLSGIHSSVYYEGTIYNAYELESGEIVLVDDYYTNSYYAQDEEDEGEWWADSYLVMPIGKVVKEPIAQEIISELEQNGYPLSDTSFYVDMRGDFEDFSREKLEEKLQGISFLAGFIVFLFVRYLMIASGVFSPLFPLRFLRKWKRYIVYYGVIYYDDSVKQIATYRKQKNYEAAAAEFARLTNTDIYEARAALNYWSEIYGEGILRMTGEK